jgi:hypothetical protein
MKTAVRVTVEIALFVGISSMFLYAALGSCAG